VGGDGRLAGMTRLFVAIWPSEPVLELLNDLERPRDQGVKWVPSENLHVTLRFLGDADIDEVTDTLDQAPLPRASVRLGPSIDVVAERSLILPAVGVDDLADVVRSATRGLGTERERPRFLGHMTLARLARRAQPSRSAGRLFEATFDVDEIALVASTLTDAGAVYETVTRWPTH
jgi:RNA 2',3'-cyclic 3'-phosphodiesterase